MNTADIATMIDHLRPRVPIDKQVWNAKDVADYLRVSARYVTERLSTNPDFPQAKRMPSAKGRGNLRWQAREVIAWWEAQ